MFKLFMLMTLSMHSGSTCLDTSTKQILETFRVPGAIIGVVASDQIIFLEGCGTRHTGKELPINEHTLFPIASCTKAFTALLLGQLVDAGKIHWDDPVKKYIPEFTLMDQETTDHLTIRDLLAHRTGIARHDPIWIFLKISQTAALELLPHLEPACNLRQNFQYNNFMYAIAGMIVERITGESWGEALTHRIFAPLKMKNSFVAREGANFSSPHAELDGTVQTIPFRDLGAITPAGGIYSTMADMLTWVKFQLSDGKGIVQKTTLQEMHTPQIPLSSKEHETMERLGYGLGWFINNYQGHTVISHGGLIDGFATEVSFIPEKKLGLVILTNSSTDGQYAITCIRNQLLDKLLDIESRDWLSQIEEMRSQDKLKLKTDTQKHVNPPTYSLKKYVGNYEHPAYGSVEIKIENSQLIAVYGSSTTPLHFKSKSSFNGELRELLIYGINPLVDFNFATNGLQIGFESFRGAKPITFNKK